jgi:predicted amidophosphoribosyltransferase
MPAVYAWGTYADPLRAAVTAWKDEGRRDLVDELVPLLRRALWAALNVGPKAVAAALVVPAPSSRRSRRTRGDVPLHDLARRAAAGPPFSALQVLAALDERRGVRDQAGLGRALGVPTSRAPSMCATACGPPWTAATASSSTTS